MVFSNKKVFFTNCNVVRPLHSINDLHWRAQLCGRVANKHLESYDLSVVDSDCQLMVPPGSGGVGELIYREGLAHDCTLEDRAIHQGHKLGRDMLLSGRGTAIGVIRAYCELGNLLGGGRFDTQTINVNNSTLFTELFQTGGRRNCYEVVKRLLIGASLSEPHIDEFAVNFLSIYIYIYEGQPHSW